MDRKNFIRKSIVGVAAAAAAPSLLKAFPSQGHSTYDKMMEQVGFNHIPNMEEKTAKTVLHRAKTRGYANHGWLDTHHTFSFANYRNPERMHFGVLRVLNDDIIAGGTGFGTHPHDNMEIISIPLEGALQHKDSMGNTHVIQAGDIQVMSAGKGIMHSEYNKNENESANFLQIWLFPNKRDVQPRYDQMRLADLERKNELHQILSPKSTDEGTWIHQNAWFHMGRFDKGQKLHYNLKDANNGVYAFIIEGDLIMEGQDLHKRDGFGIWDTDSFDITWQSDGRILLMEVPMQL
jgi:redox-sensitive bicupin YhaK (pirin superfamily)